MTRTARHCSRRRHQLCRARAGPASADAGWAPAAGRSMRCRRSSREAPERFRSAYEISCADRDCRGPGDRECRHSLRISIAGRRRGDGDALAIRETRGGIEMPSHRAMPGLFTVGLLMFAGAAVAQTPAQTVDSRWVIDVGVGVDPSINGNVNSGAIGTLQGFATAILPQSYGEVYGTGIGLHFGGGYVLDAQSELRAMFTWQSADADLVRLGDIGPSSLYAQYDDYKSFGLDVGYRRYFSTSSRAIRPYAEAMIGIAWVDGIDAQFAAPQAHLA